MRVQKFLAEKTGLGRRIIEKAIAAGEISIQGKVCKLGASVEPGDKVFWEGSCYRVLNSDTAKNAPIMLLYHKRLGELSARSDHSSRPTVFDRLPRCPDGRWINIGRLDINTSGLLLFTNDGLLAHQWMHPKNGLERVYHVRVFPIPETKSIERLLQGIELDGEKVCFQKVTPLCKPSSVLAKNTWYEVMVTSGRYRMIRRLWEKVGCQVSILKRVSYGQMSLPDDLQPGEYRIINMLIKR